MFECLKIISMWLSLESEISRLWKSFITNILPANKSITWSVVGSNPIASPSKTEWNESASTVKKSRRAIFLPPFGAVTQSSWWDTTMVSFWLPLLSKVWYPVALFADEIEFLKELFLEFWLLSPFSFWRSLWSEAQACVCTVKALNHFRFKKNILLCICFYIIIVIRMKN